jgi:hypothetical protein
LDNLSCDKPRCFRNFFMFLAIVDFSFDIMV